MVFVLRRSLNQQYKYHNFIWNFLTRFHSLFLNRVEIKVLRCLRMELNKIPRFQVMILCAHNITICNRQKQVKFMVPSKLVRLINHSKLDRYCHWA